MKLRFTVPRIQGPRPEPIRLLPGFAKQRFVSRVTKLEFRHQTCHVAFSSAGRVVMATTWTSS
jgi:hypothetical protein